MVKLATKYNPYSDIETVYNAKVAWNNATTDEERKKASDIATAARKQLEAYGYGDVANQISASGADATAARKVLEQYAPKTTTSTTSANTDLINKNNNEVNTKINQLWGTQQSDREVMTDKYNKLEETAYTNPFTTDEAKAILGKYSLAGLQGRDNAVASGGASNGGNIDSYSSANAMRQQVSLISQGQTKVLEEHNNKINNVKGILADLGVYQQNQDKGMQTTIGVQQEEGQRLFENDETAKNNEVARLSEQASVTGYVPNEWVIKNDDIYSQFLNEDGTFKTEKENVDIQALINQAKASGDTETANKLAVVRTRKILGNYGKFGQYSNVGDIASMKPQQTEAGRTTDVNAKVALDTLTTNSADTRYGIDAEKEINAANNQNAVDQIKAQAEAEKEVLKYTKELSDTGGVTALSEDGADIFKQVSKNINQNIVKNYSEKYNLSDDYEIIIWNGGTDYKLNLPEGHVASWWKTQIIRPILESSMSEADKGAVIANLFGSDANKFAEEVYTEMKKYGLTK